MNPCYRPQQSCGQGNVFTGVCLSTGGEGVCLSACWDAIPPGWRTPQMENPPNGEPHPRMENPPWMENPPGEAHSSIRSTSSQYVSYWNAFLVIL